MVIFVDTESIEIAIGIHIMFNGFAFCKIIQLINVCTIILHNDSRQRIIV